MNNIRKFIPVIIIGVLAGVLDNVISWLLLLAIIVYLLVFKRNKSEVIKDVVDARYSGVMDGERTDAFYRKYFPKECVNEKETFHKSSEIFTLLDELMLLVKKNEVKDALQSIKEDTKLLLTPSFASEVEQNAMNKFETFYLPKTIEQLAYYKKLLSKDALNDAQHSTMVNVEEAILSISKIFKDYVASAGSAEAFNMEAEARAIKRMVDSDVAHSDFDWKA